MMKQSRLKLNRKKGRPPDLPVMNFSNQTMDYNEALQSNTWVAERKYADKIIYSCRKLNHKVKLDRLTKGEGNCFMISILQQLKSSDVYSHLSSELKTLADEMNPMNLRRQVTNFITTSNHPSIRNLKALYYPDPASSDPKTWKEYWERMLVNGHWPSHYFILATAWFVKHDIWIYDTSCTEEKPVYHISGNIDDPDKEAEHDDPLRVGLLTNIHYQSLLVD